MQSEIDTTPEERLQTAKAVLERCLSHAGQAKRRFDPEAEADICLSVRTVFCAFVDLNAWSRIWGGADEIGVVADDLILLFSKAAELLRRSNGPKSSLYIESAEQKIEYIQGLKAGKSLYELTRAR